MAPSDCALLLEVPLSREEFFADLSDDAPKDLAKSLRRHWRLNNETLWSRLYEPFANLAVKIAEEVATLNVTVLRRTGLQGLTCALAQHKVVTYVSHWMSRPYIASDIIDLLGFRARLGETPRKEQSEVCPVELALWEDQLTRSAASEAELAGAINLLLRATDRAFAWVPADGTHDSGLPPAGITRVQIEECFPTCFAFGPCLESADGLRTAREFIDAVPREFSGTIDLTVCHSLIIAEALKRHRPECTVIANRQRAIANVRLIIYRHVVRSLARSPEPFAHVMARVHLELLRRRREVNT